MTCAFQADTLVGGGGEIASSCWPTAPTAVAPRRGFEGVDQMRTGLDPVSLRAEFDPFFRAELAEVEVELEALEMTRSASSSSAAAASRSRLLGARDQVQEIQRRPRAPDEGLGLTRCPTGPRRHEQRPPSVRRQPPLQRVYFDHGRVSIWQCQQSQRSIIAERSLGSETHGFRPQPRTRTPARQYHAADEPSSSAKTHQAAQEGWSKALSAVPPRSASSARPLLEAALAAARIETMMMMEEFGKASRFGLPSRPSSSCPRPP